MRRLALVAIVLAGCGGDGGSLTREEFVAELDRICADFNAEEEAIGEAQSLQDVAELGPEVLEEFGAALDRVRDLGEPPAEIADDVDRFLEAGDEQRELLGEIIEAAQANDLGRVDELAERGQTLNAEANDLAHELGADECADD